tara:strand:+ start:103 stop:366 length:264 start_codon:yes stop_codon:yes gene_type:complete
MPKLDITKKFRQDYKSMSYEECETIEEKIICCEYLLNAINLCRGEAKSQLSGMLGVLKNETDNDLYWEKLYQTRLRILRKQLKKQKK